MKSLVSLRFSSTHTNERWRESVIEILLAIIVFVVSLFAGDTAFAQPEIHITGPQAGFPIAVPKLCDAGEGSELTAKIPDTISRNLQITGLFRVLQPGSFVETAGKCASSPDEFAFTDWSVIGADLLVRGEVRRERSSRVSVKLYLFDVVKRQAVVGKHYQAEDSDAELLANRFSNEVMRFIGSEPIFGTKVAYVSKVGRFKELFVMDITGLGVKQLTQDRGLALSPAWSPSGDRLVYTSYRTRQPELYFLPASGGSPVQITKRDGLELGAEFSPDGQTLVSGASILGDSTIVLFDFRGKILNQLTQGGALDVSPTYSPDRRSIAFCSNRSGGPQIYMMDSGGGNARRISFTTSNYCTSPAWSPKGDKLAYVCRYDGGHQIFLSAPDGSQPVQLTFSGTNEDPSWSPGGEFLVFASSMGRGGKSIFLMSLRSGTATQLTFSKSEDSQPAWAPVSE